MSNFGRVVRLALRHRLSFIGAILCALAVGLLWGANITAVYPFVEVVFEGHSLHQWVDDKIDECRHNTREFQATIDAKTIEFARAPREAKPALESEIDDARKRLKTERAALRAYLWARPYLLRYTPDDAFLTLAMLLGLVLLGTLAKSLFVVAHTILVARLTQLSTFALRKQFFRRTLRLDVATFSNDGTADLLSRFTHDMENVAQGLAALFGKLVREPVKGAVCLIGAGMICWQLLVLSLVVAPVAGLLIRWLARMLKRANRRAMEEMAQLFGTLEEAFRGINVVKSFTMERHERTRFHAKSKKYYRCSMRIARYDSLSHPMTEILGMVMICLAMLAGAWLVIQKETHLFGIPMCSRPLSLGSLLWFYALLAGAADPARKLSDVFTCLQRGAAAADRIYALLDRQPQVRDPRHPRPLGRHHQSLAFENVCFSYFPGRPVLREINLDVRFGETIAVVGPSGCGKSTLANLVPRFADPDSGCIRIDGIRLSDVRLRVLRGQIGVVTQEPLLFDDTVFNNIRYGSPHATRQQVVEAAKRAHADRFIEHELPHGYNTTVGPMGGQLSGGQRQRIALARAILRDPAILILDEATSQIDVYSERLIHNALERFRRGRTTILITHRLGALALADRIVVLQDGRVLDVGTHQELITRCEFYRRMHQPDGAQRKASA